MLVGVRMVVGWRSSLSLVVRHDEDANEQFTNLGSRHSVCRRFEPVQMDERQRVKNRRCSFHGWRGIHCYAARPLSLIPSKCQPGTQQHPPKIRYALLMSCTGRYDAATRSIEVFVDRIKQDARTFGAEPEELLEIVRIHEHAHAVIHLGSRADKADHDLSALGEAGKTDWSAFVRSRALWFTAFPKEIHEFLAQALTYAALSELSPERRSERLVGVFNALEARQPAHYRLSASVKNCVAQADWPLILDAARGDVDVYREQDFVLAQGLEALICAVAETTLPNGSPAERSGNSAHQRRAATVGLIVLPNHEPWNRP